ncbi:hypothetical protein [Lentzea kentuckyensis]|uniref:hypothetical protein n=1 Tax=Lentzea kentuckyensis TaxID=360086 RepID=UPI000A381868|nr:hypothetical protein [Lentzea kentuckyensis]
MHKKARALLLSTFALTSLVVVTAPAAHADTFSQVGYASGRGRQVYLWRNDTTGCLHAQGKSMRNGDRVMLLASMGGNVSAPANADGVSVNTPSRCTKAGTDYNGYIDLLGSEEGPMTGSYRNF